MDRKQTSVVNMLRTVEAVGDLNPTAIAKVPAFMKTHAELKDKVEQIRLVAKSQKTGTKGLKTSKATLKKDLAEMGATIAAVLQGYASETKNTLLFEEVKFTKSDLLSGSAEGQALNAETILEKAKALAPELKNSGLDDTIIANYEQLVADFRKSMPTTTLAINKRSVQTDNLGTLINQAKDLLKLRMDKTGAIFSTIDPPFYALYKNARKVRDIGSRKDTSGMINGTVKDASGKPVSDALIELVESGNIFLTDIDGKYEFDDINAGIHTIKISKVGFKTLLQESIKVAAKEEVVKDIQLVGE